MAKGRSAISANFEGTDAKIPLINLADSQCLARNIRFSGLGKGGLRAPRIKSAVSSWCCCQQNLWVNSYKQPQPKWRRPHFVHWKHSLQMRMHTENETRQRTFQVASRLRMLRWMNSKGQYGWDGWISQIWEKSLMEMQAPWDVTWSSRSEDQSFEKSLHLFSICQPSAEPIGSLDAAFFFSIRTTVID
jgi:hypothetical protein